MPGTLGNSGAPRWYDCNLDRFPDYLDLLEQCGATGAEIVLHDGDADEFTSRVHVVRPDWEYVIRGYRDRHLKLSVHGPLTPEFSPLRWQEQPERTLARYQPVLDQVAEVASDQGEVTLVLHALADSNQSLATNEQVTAEFVATIADQLQRRHSQTRVVIELRAFRLSRPTAAATTRESIMRVIELADHPEIGICWDLAHDLESRIAVGEPWIEPEGSFLRHVRHIHLHDLGNDDEPHYPPILGRVPQESALDRLPDVAKVMEVRWRMAERMGQPWDVLRESYRVVQERSRS